MQADSLPAEPQGKPCKEKKKKEYLYINHKQVKENINSYRSFCHISLFFPRGILELV